jgi:hypothetical protein
MIYRPRRNDGHAEWLIEKQMRAAETHKTHWLIHAQASLERSLQNIRSPDEWEEEFWKQLDKDLRNADASRRKPAPPCLRSSTGTRRPGAIAR